MTNLKGYISKACTCCILVLFLAIFPLTESEGNRLSLGESQDIINTDSSPCSVDFYGKWRVIGFLPNALSITGVLQPYKYQLIACDALGKELEYQFDYYRFEETVYNNITYHIQTITLSDNEVSEYLQLISSLNLLTDPAGETTPYFADEKGLHSVCLIYIEGVANEYLPRVHSKEDDPATVAIEFILIDKNTIYCTISGLLCKKM